MEHATLGNSNSAKNLCVSYTPGVPLIQQPPKLTPGAFDRLGILPPADSDPSGQRMMF